MTSHQDDHLSFDIPRDWHDKSVVAYAAPAREHRASVANVVMTYDSLAEDEDLEGYAGRQIDLLAEQLGGFALRSHVATKVAERAARSVSFVSHGDAGPLEQRLTVIALPDGQIAALTMTAPHDEAAQMAPLFARILSSVKIAEGSA